MLEQRHALDNFHNDIYPAYFAIYYRTLRPAMAESSGEPTAAPAKPNIIEELVDAGTTAFNPQSSSESQKQGRERYDAVIERYTYFALPK